MERYVERARSALFLSTSSRKPLTTIDAYRHAAARYPAAARSWLNRLEQLDLRQARSLLEKVPQNRISDVAVDFAYKMLVLNYSRLLALKEA